MGKGCGQNVARNYIKTLLEIGLFWHMSLQYQVGVAERIGKFVHPTVSVRQTNYMHLMYAHAIVILGNSCIEMQS